MKLHLNLLLIISITACSSNSKQAFNQHLANSNNYVVVCNFENALKEMELAKAIEPSNAMVYYGLGQIYFMRNNYEKAIAYFDTAIELDSNFTIAFYSRSLTKSFLGNDKGGLEDVARALKLEPDLIMAIMHSAALKINSRDYNGAITDLTSAIKYKNDLAIAFYWRGRIYGSILHEYDKAIADLNKAIEFKIVKINTYTLRSDYEYAIGKKDDACADYYKAKELGDTSLNLNIENYCKS